MDSLAIQSAVIDHALATGYFESVNGHEPKSAPGNGIRCSVYVMEIRPTRQSGLQETSVVLAFNVRTMTSMLAEPQDEIDTNLLEATDALMARYSADFDLDIDEVRNVDLLGQEGAGGLMARAGYIDIDNKKYRCFDIQLPIIVDDIWAQSP